MARRTPNALISEDLPPVRRMGNQLQQGMHFDPTYWWLTISDELPLGFPLVHTLKHQAPVYPEAEVLPIGKRPCPIPGYPCQTLTRLVVQPGLILKCLAMNQMIPSCQFPAEWEGISMKYIPFPGKLPIGSHSKGKVTMVCYSQIWYQISLRK